MTTFIVRALTLIAIIVSANSRKRQHRYVQKRRIIGEAAAAAVMALEGETQGGEQPESSDVPPPSVETE